MSRQPIVHDSDCARHNEPAYPNGPCNCSVSKQWRDRIALILGNTYQVGQDLFGGQHVSLPRQDFDDLLEAAQVVAAMNREAAEPVDWPLRAKVWKRTNPLTEPEWVLEIQGALNDTHMTSRHTEPLSTPYEDVPGLPSLYAAPQPPFDAVAVVEGLRNTTYDALDENQSGYMAGFILGRKEAADEIIRALRKAQEGRQAKGGDATATEERQPDTGAGDNGGSAPAPQNIAAERNYRVVLSQIRQRSVQAIGAGLSTRNWHMTEAAYNELRDRLDDLLRQMEPWTRNND